MTNDISNSKNQSPPVFFCGVDALEQRLTALAMQSKDLHTTNKLNAVVAELRLLDRCLQRLRHERSWLDEQDIDMFIDRLRCIQQGGAR